MLLVQIVYVWDSLSICQTKINNMRKILSLVVLVCLFSCKKSTPALENATSGEKNIEVKVNNTSNTASRMSDCAYYEKLTEISPGVWKGLYKGTWVTFNNLQVRGNRLYGNLINAQNATIVEGGGEEVSRIFAFQATTCTGGLSLTKTVSQESYVEFNSMTSNNSYVYYNNSVSSFSDFLIDMVNNTIYVGSQWYRPNEYYRTKYEFGSVPNCSTAQLFIGKLIAIKNTSTGLYEWGIAPACFEDAAILVEL